MKPIAAIVEPAEGDVARAARAVDHAITVLSVAEANVRERRLELGRALIAARRLFPATGRNAGGWSRFVAARRLDMDVALDAMKYAGWVDEHQPDRQPGDELPTREQAGLDRPPPEKGSAPAGVFSPPPSEIEIDRDTWCTPKWITDAIGDFDLDPCSNERSTVRAVYTYRLDRGEDGLKLLTSKWMDGRSVRVFVNPPYSDVPPWIMAYEHTRFCYLLKFDPSTRWFAELIKNTELVLIPRGTRIQFEPPPGVPPEKAVANQFPHALFYAREEDATPEIRALCFAWRVQHQHPDERT